MKKLFLTMIMAVLMQTVFAQSDSIKCDSQCDSAKVCCSFSTDFPSLQNLISKKTVDDVRNLLTVWGYSCLQSAGAGTSDGVFNEIWKKGNVEHNGNWVFYPDEKWAGIDFTLLKERGVTSFTWTFTSKECYEKLKSDLKAAGWVPSKDFNTGISVQTDYRNGTKEFVTLQAYSYGTYSIMYNTL
ncbi:MAG: hypothetical protein MJZ32_00540 [Bacteroidaceae bacterium]|nr:hypothetical protein [Bacteroidaceae bacterium]